MMKKKGGKEEGRGKEGRGDEGEVGGAGAKHLPRSRRDNFL